MQKPWFSKSILDTGLPVLVSSMPSPSVTAVFMVRAGSKDEDPKEAGISHVLEHFVFRGTKKYSTGRKVMRALDSIGAEHNAATGKECTYYWVRSSRSHIERAIEFLGEIVFRPKLPEELLIKEKGTILQEIAMYKDLPTARAEELFEETIFGKDTELGRTIIGSAKTVSSITRNQLLSYRALHYRPDTCAFAVAGGAGEEEVVKLAERFLGQFAKEAHKSGRSYQIHKTDSVQPFFKAVEHRKTDQAHLVFGVKTFGRLDERRYALAVLSAILGGNASSQLFEEIREKRGLAYYIRSGMSDYVPDGYLSIRAGVPPAKAAMVESLILDHLAHFSFSKKECIDAKEFLKGSLALDWEETQHIAGYLADEFLFEPHMRGFRDLVNAVDRVTAEEVEELAKELFKRALYVSAVGPLNKDLKLI